MKFEIQQRYGAPPALVIERFCLEEFYLSLPDFDRIKKPDLLDITEQGGGQTVVRLRRRFSADLPAAAKMIVDPDRLSWVDETLFDLNDHTATTKMLPDHYGSKLVASAASTFTASGGDTERVVKGDLRVKILLGASQVEAAIISGLGEYLGEEAAAFEAFLD